MYFYIFIIIMNFKFLIIICSLLIAHCSLFSGPPFNTDDPEPVDFRHWEFYISSINTFIPGFSTGTLPHFEVNYGVVPNVQLHCVIPLEYQESRIKYQDNSTFEYGYGY